MTENYQLIPEWAQQEAVMLVWPDQHTDWQPWLIDVQSVYLKIIQSLNQANTNVVLLVRDGEIKNCLSKLENSSQVLIVKADYNDTWIRDYGFLSCVNASGLQPIEFVFNGWGQKFDAAKDNKINQQVLSQLCQQGIQSVDLVIEGGALEIDQHGTLLSTELCLTNPKRNGAKTIASYQDDFQQFLGAKQSFILGNGHLEGDDTDGHIDTLVRFTPDNGLVIQSAFNRPDDTHFQGLSDLVNECRQVLPTHKIFELPLPHIVNQQGDRLPASYANFLISNQHILCPIYQQTEDKLAMQVIQKAYPDFTIVPINCLPLVQQFGSLHCISMQIPCGILKPEILQSFVTGVSVYE
ncbi:agmatine deiminase family protein [uncultured Paraglaciecola sp.]|uniref:agmatine deiminase family protein n=1 Tax=uncultured Paraglaciecola sp. TaxID=1765024 RepID=UPI0030DAE6B6|tara:strand:+ start:229872 stop:230927 length:1056 start_codon:yes stop_codon:yes gene_type:complete